MPTFAFDIYGTLINPMALAQKLQTIVGDQAFDFNNLWRDKQLEYSFRFGEKMWIYLNNKNAKL